MLRLASVLACLLAFTTGLQAHFVFIVPQGNNQVQVVFSDSLEPDENVPIDRIKDLKLYALDVAGKTVAVAWKQAEHSLLATVPSDVQALGGVCTYGVFQRGEGKPSLLIYYPKMIAGPLTSTKAWDQLPLEIVPLGSNRFVFLHSGKPVPEADVTVMLPGDKRERLKTDANGQFQVNISAPGLYGLYARHVAAKEGEHGGKRYEQVTSYATLVFRSGATAGSKSVEKHEGEDPGATALLADARAARAVWNRFPGFTADAKVNWDGKEVSAKIKVAADGKVTVEGIEDKTLESWTRRVLGSVIAHRLPSGSLQTPCAFADVEENHPLGRLINVLNDEMHSSYRIRDRQIMVVNRVTPDGRFSIMMQHNQTTPEGKFLPTAFVVNYFDKEGNLIRSEANYHSWKRLGEFDLPVLTRVITAGKESTVREIELSNHRLNADQAAK